VAFLSTHLSHEIIWRILVAAGALPALAVYGARRNLKESPRFLKAAAHEEDELGNLRKADHFDKKTHSAILLDGFHRLVDNKKILGRLIGDSRTRWSTCLTETNPSAIDCKSRSVKTRYFEQD
jgi:MFS transporter, PHS family, inorganic phosphate transporter